MYRIPSRGKTTSYLQLSQKLITCLTTQICSRAPKSADCETSYTKIISYTSTLDADHLYQVLLLSKTKVLSTDCEMDNMGRLTPI